MIKAVGLTIVFLCTWCESRGQSRTTLFKNFIVIDGSGRPGTLQDVRIQGDRISLIGTLIAQPGEQVIDGLSQYVLAPGFIDTHSHHSRNLDDSSQFSSFLCQGITTLVVGQDGSSYLPLQSYFQDRLKIGLPVNLASYTGHNTMRYQILGKEANRLATKAEVKAMKKLLRADIKAGSLGLSTGLEYDPGIFSSKRREVAHSL